MNLDRRQGQIFGDLRVLDSRCLVDRLALDPFGDERTRRDRGTAAEGLELGVLDDAFRTHLDLQFHHVAASRRADEARADAFVVLIERTDIAGILVVIDDLVAVSHGSVLPLSALYISGFDT